MGAVSGLRCEPILQRSHCDEPEGSGGEQAETGWRVITTCQSQTRAVGTGETLKRASFEDWEPNSA